MKVSESQLDGIVDKVVQELKSKQSENVREVNCVKRVEVSRIDVNQVTNIRFDNDNSYFDKSCEYGCFETIEMAIAASKRAFQEYQQISLSQRGRIIVAIRRFARERAKTLAQMAREETGLGRYEDKIKKNYLAIEKTPGTDDISPQAFSGDHGLTLIEFAPYGVIGSITPCTNPSETVINNGISMLAGGNTVVFNPHPAAKKVSAYTVSLLNQAVVAEGGPKNLLTTVVNPTIATANQLMVHADVALLVVTGGPAVVKAAMKSGKRVIAAGPGNPPVVVDESADLEKAAKDILTSSSMDNNIICVLEKEIIVTQKAHSAFKKAFKNAGAYEISSYHGTRLTKLLIDDTGHPNKQFVGKDIGVILAEIGLPVDTTTRLAFIDTEANHLFAKTELLMPIIPLITVSNIDQAIGLAYRLEGGCGHTAVIHSRNIENMHKMALKMNTAIFVKNGPALAGIGFEGEGPCSFTIAAPTGEGVTTARHFVRARRCVLGHGYFRIV
ncbi:MAG: aldehyde dehydrogenase EutE [Oligoflexia bacterium]|nr:aldehyde dehydrogenase EutE [Oligoflexia bacterium]